MQAHVLRKLHQLYKTTTLQREGGLWTAPKIEMLARQLGVHKSTISRCIDWLSRQGFILVKKWRWGRSPRLYIRMLVHLSATRRATSTQLETPLTNKRHATCNYNTNKKSNIDNMQASPETCEDLTTLNKKEDLPRIRLKNKISRVPARVREAKERRDAEPPKDTATDIGQRWQGMLRAWEGKTFPLDPKTLRHINLARGRMKDAGLDLRDHLETIIEEWSQFAPKEAGKVPVPWAFLRSFKLYLDFLAERKQHATVNKTTTAVTPPAVSGSQTPPPVIKRNPTLAERMKAKWGKK